MIFGIGTDIVEVERIMNMNSLDKFAKKILSFEELKGCNSLIEEKKISFLAKQFAAKEAVSKALGTGIGESVKFNEIEILRNEYGKPYINSTGMLTNIFDDLGIIKTHVSLSDENKYTLAFVILEI